MNVKYGPGTLNRCLSLFVPICKHTELYEAEIVKLIANLEFDAEVAVVEYWDLLRFDYQPPRKVFLTSSLFSKFVPVSCNTISPMSKT